MLFIFVGGFDLVFIDVDKELNMIYFDWVVKFGYLGMVIVLDNVGCEGEIVDEYMIDLKVIGMCEGLWMLGEDLWFDVIVL